MNMIFITLKGDEYDIHHPQEWWIWYSSPSLGDECGIFNIVEYVEYCTFITHFVCYHHHHHHHHHYQNSASKWRMSAKIQHEALCWILCTNPTFWCWIIDNTLFWCKIECFSWIHIIPCSYIWCNNYQHLHIVPSWEKLQDTTNETRLLKAGEMVKNN